MIEYLNLATPNTGKISIILSPSGKELIFRSAIFEFLFKSVFDRSTYIFSLNFYERQ